MKGLILNGSPRRDGKIGRLMKYAAEVSGEDVEVVNVYDLNIRPCTACMKCRITGHCVFPAEPGHGEDDPGGFADRRIPGVFAGSARNEEMGSNSR